MEQKEQARFVSSLVNSVANELLDKIGSGRVPEEWDGFELRWWIAQRFEEATLGSRSNNKKRFRSFKNDILVRNL